MMREAYYLMLKELNLKATPKRLAMLEILAGESAYLNPEEVLEKMKKRFKKLGLPTVYRNLEDLAKGGIITKIMHPNRQLYYYFCQNKKHHHHFICVSCRKVEDIDFCGQKELALEVKKKIKGKVLSHLLQVNGLCQECSGN